MVVLVDTNTVDSRSGPRRRDGHGIGCYKGESSSSGRAALGEFHDIAIWSIWIVWARNPRRQPCVPLAKGTQQSTQATSPPAPSSSQRTQQVESHITFAAMCFVRRSTRVFHRQRSPSPSLAAPFDSRPSQSAFLLRRPFTLLGTFSTAALESFCRHRVVRRCVADV